jgi:hypothetical protein
MAWKAIMGQKFTNFEHGGVLATYDLGHIELKDAQIALDTAVSQTGDIRVNPRGYRLQDGAPGFDVTSHFHKNWDDKVGGQYSVHPRGEGIVSDWSELNRYGVRFSVMDSRHYDELRLYDIGRFSSRPFNMTSLVVTHSSFSRGR